jgi:hypothetical protein
MNALSCSITGFLQQTQLQLGTIGDGARLVLGFGNLPRKVLGENDGVLFLRCVLRHIARVQQISPERQMGPVLFEDAERQQARTPCALTIASLKSPAVIPPTWPIVSSARAIGQA